MTTKNQEAGLWPDCDYTTYSEANKIGRDRAANLIERIRRTDNPALFGIVAEAIADKGKPFGGVEIGFFHEMSVELMRSSIREFVEVPAERPRSTRKMGCLRIVA